MKTYLISVAATCLLLVLLETMLSEGKTKKYVQGILRLVIVIVILSPIVGIVNKDFNFEKLFSENGAQIETTNQNIMDDYIVEKTEKAIENKLNGRESKVCTVKINEKNGVISSIVVTVKENGINTTDENIFTNEKIIEAVTDVIEIDKDRIIVYGTKK